jgi:hypothetical protein
MPAGLSIAIALLAVPGAGEPAPPPPPQTAAPKADEPCRTQLPSADTTEIVVCAERPQGYRLDPDVRTAKRLKRSQPRRRSNEHMKDTACASVGPMGCTGGAGINVIAAAITAATMIDKAVRGENVGSMFVTRPEASEYELYVAAKREREAAEAAAKAEAKAKSAAAASPAAAAAPAGPKP